MEMEQDADIGMRMETRDLTSAGGRIYSSSMFNPADPDMQAKNMMGY